MKLSIAEKIKVASKGLRGTLKESLLDEHTGALREDDQILVKFHGMYQQDDRDRREQRAEKRLERLYSYMIRLRLPGGYLTAAQWVASQKIAGENASGVIKVTTRQTIQLHGILKSKIKPTIKAFNQHILDSIAACGDVNRNVVMPSYPIKSAHEAELRSLANSISEYLKPKSRAYYEIWLDEEKIAERVEEDLLYEDRYLPRKFKVAIAMPPNNDVDVYTNDVGLIAIVEKDQIIGYNVTIGGGMGATHGNKSTYPKMASTIGFVRGTENALKAVYEIATVQRDYGNREDRKLSRLKYTVEKFGIPFLKTEIEKRLGFKFEEERSVVFTQREDVYGWNKSDNGFWRHTLFIENGRIFDTETIQLKTAILKITEANLANVRFSCHQNLILVDIDESNKAKVDALLAEYGVSSYNESVSKIRKNAMACVAFNTCPLALAEAQRYMPAFISKVEPLLLKYNLQNENIIMRMTGCPNGCARPYAAEIGLVGTALGLYNLYLGADRLGLRVNKLFKENLNETALLTELDRLFYQYSIERKNDETLGDFCCRVILP
jgi:sulfite reductase (NADPH) hemoprotein beta-component